MLIQQVVRMLSLGLIHCDLSEFNVLLAPDGPVIIDLPQVVNADSNNAAFASFSAIRVIDDARKVAVRRSRARDEQLG